MSSLSIEAKRWGDDPEISARSVLVTVLGDSVAPLGGEIWLADLFDLAQPFGFNQRLVRTSMYRLANEDWLENERVGRRSRYRLTPFAVLEFADADRRIYRRNPPPWDGVWSMVFTETLLTDQGESQRRLSQHLRWHGFVEISRGVWALPAPSLEATNELLDRLQLDVRPPVARARFDQLDQLVDQGLFRSSFALADTEKAYRRFIDRYQGLDTEELDTIECIDAFCLRTMIIHDLRRARLSDPDLPTALLPDGWIGEEAFNLAGRLYRRITDRAWTAVENATDLKLSNSDGRLQQRFAEGAAPN